jgi:hypothetical protein
LICPVGCPNYELPRPKHHCRICGSGIYEGEEYIENEDGEFIHYECINGVRDLIKWLGGEIRVMK